MNSDPGSFVLAQNENPVLFRPRMGNRHGLITGATGTGKTVTLQVLAENFSRLGVPVFLPDVKGDLSGLARPGTPEPAIDRRREMLGVADHPFEGYPLLFWDLFGRAGLPLRTTVSDMGPLLLSRLFDLNETQSGVLSVLFRMADDEGLLLLDLKDLRALLSFVQEKDTMKEVSARYGLVSAASLGAIQRALLTLEEQGGEHLFGEPMLRVADLLGNDDRGYGRINVLAADELIQRPRLYAAFLLWLLSELYENLPEVGDLDKPRLILCFDEAHLIFRDAPEALMEKVELVVRLIRSKGVGVYFITQNPADVPEVILGQLGNRVMHALRAFTPKDQKAVRAAAQTFRQNPRVDAEKVLTELEVGEALVSLLDPKGVPLPVERAWVLPPRSQIGPIPSEERRRIGALSPLASLYEEEVDRESAYEKLSRRVEASSPEPEALPPAPPKRPERAEPDPLPPRSERPPLRRGDTLVEAMAKSAMRAASSQLGRTLVRSVLGSLLGGSTRRF